MKNKAVIVVYVNTDGLDEMIAHILDGSLDKHNPEVRVVPEEIVRKTETFAGVRHGNSLCTWPHNATTRAFDLACSIDDHHIFETTTSREITES